MEIWITLALVGRLGLAVMVSVLTSFDTMRGILSNCITDEPIILDSDDKSKDGDDKIDTKLAPMIGAN
jgi:hypothetical protein